MQHYQTITVEPHVPRRIFLPAGALLGVSDPEGGQPFALGLEEGAALEVVSSTAPSLRAGDLLRRQVEIKADFYTGVALTLRAARSQWVEIGTTASAGLLTPESALRVRLPLALPDGPFADLPLPLASVLAEYRIDGATALTYLVKAGQFIEIVNVEGSQCADFLAFAGPSWAEELDGAATRTRNGSALPCAGLHGKYFSQEMRPLVEIIQDTCGRHDSFLLACQDSYYEDNGYPGHASCTTNFNLNLGRHGVAGRKGWPAVNFFFNTEVGADGTIHSGESWARPGDYVLLQAQTDLLCATSSCADDIDPVNGWNPTPIHVRIYEADANLARSSGRRLSESRPPQMTRDTAFTPRVRALTDDLVDAGGVWLPSSYAATGEYAEYWALRRQAALMDLSALRKFEVAGPDTTALLQAAFSRDVTALSVGQSAYGCLPNRHGGIVSDGIVFKLSETSYRFVGNCETDGDWLRRIAEDCKLSAQVRSSSDRWHNLAVQGPRSRDVLNTRLTLDGGEPLETLAPFRFATGHFGAIPVFVSRTGYTGERGYELFVAPENGAALWDALMDAGAPEGLTPLGLAALDRARIEAGLPAPGREFDAGVSPFQAGIGWTVARDKSEQVGRAALERLRLSPPRVAVGLSLEGSEVAPIGECVYAPGDLFPAGRVTSATFSPVLNRSIALAQVFPEYAAPGTALEVGFVDGLLRRVHAVTGATAAYDPKKRRVRE